MRIVCDHCSLPISGTVKKTTGNMNLHPECPTRPSKNEQSDLFDGRFRNGENYTAGNIAQSTELKPLLATKRRKVKRNRLATLRRRFLSRCLTSLPTRKRLVYGANPSKRFTRRQPTIVK
jgi:hypothetical protein